MLSFQSTGFPDEKSITEEKNNFNNIHKINSIKFEVKIFKTVLHLDMRCSIIGKNQKIKKMKDRSMILYHGRGEIVEYPEIRKAKFNMSFYFGFYCTKIEEQAKRWASRYGSDGYLNKYEYIPNSNLSYLTFPEMTEEWLDFVVACRSGKAHKYDIVEGPMADDTIYNYIQNFIDRKISRAAFWELVKFKYPTHQISFHSISALDTLTFIGSEVVYGDKK